MSYFSLSYEMKVTNLFDREWIGAIGFGAYNCMQQLCVFIHGYVYQSLYSMWKYVEGFAKDASLLCLEQHWGCFERKMYTKMANWIGIYWKEGCHRKITMVYDIVYRNVFSTFRYTSSGQQCAFLSLFTIFYCRCWLQLPLCKCLLVMKEALLNLCQFWIEDSKYAHIECFLY